MAALQQRGEQVVGRLDAAPGSCCNPETLQATSGEAFRVLVDGTDVYWFETEDGVAPDLAYGPADIYRLPRSGGTVETVVAGFAARGAWLGGELAGLSPNGATRGREPALR